MSLNIYFQRKKKACLINPFNIPAQQKNILEQEARNSLYTITGNYRA